MKRYRMVTSGLLFLALLFSLAAASLAWLSNRRDVSPPLSLSAGGPEDYVLYRVRSEDGVTAVCAEIGTVGSEGKDGPSSFAAADLELGKIKNLSTLEYSNYVYYVIRVPKEQGGSVTLSVEYGDTDGDGEHFKIYVPVKDESGNVITDGEGTVSTVLFTDEAALQEIRAVETEGEATFLSFSWVISDRTPVGEQSLSELEALFAEEPTHSLSAELPAATVDTAALEEDYYYVYVRLQPNLLLYKNFIEHLWDHMPFFLAYEVRVSLDVTP